jgi:hypothetical protein
MYRLASRINRPIEIFARLSHLAVGLIHTIGRACQLQVRTYPLVNVWSISLNPAEDSSMVHGKPTLSHHLFQVLMAELVSAIPSDAQENDRGLVMTPFERGFMLFQDYDSRKVIDEPKQDNNSKAIPATEPITLYMTSLMVLDELGASKPMFELCKTVRFDVLKLN